MPGFAAALGLVRLEKTGMGRGLSGSESSAAEWSGCTLSYLPRGAFCFFRRAGMRQP